MQAYLRLSHIMYYWLQVGFSDMAEYHILIDTDYNKPTLYQSRLFQYLYGKVYYNNKKERSNNQMDKDKIATSSNSLTLQLDHLESQNKQNLKYKNYNVNQSKKLLSVIPQVSNSQFSYEQNAQNNNVSQLSQYDIPDNYQKDEIDTNICTPRSLFDTDTKNYYEVVTAGKRPQFAINQQKIYIRNWRIQDLKINAKIKVGTFGQYLKFVNVRHAKPLIQFRPLNHKLFHMSTIISDLNVSRPGIVQPNLQQKKKNNHIGIGICTLEKDPKTPLKSIIFTNQGKIIQCCNKKGQNEIQSHDMRKFKVKDRVIVKYNAAQEKVELLVDQFEGYKFYDGRKIRVSHYQSQMFKDKSLIWRPCITMEGGCHGVVVENLKVIYEQISSL